MNVDVCNEALLSSHLDALRVFPRLRLLQQAPFQFSVDFGLNELPREAGIILLRGPRQYGKSTWLEQQTIKTYQEFGPGSSLYINGDEVISQSDLRERIEYLLPLFSGPQKRLFIDEISSIKDWPKALKILADAGKLEDVLVVTTGSRASDLRRGSERLPGRKGKLARTDYIFTPVSYKEFHRQCFSVLGADTLLTYLLAGGSPLACNELVSNGYIPEYLATLVKDWVFGEFARDGRQRSQLLAILQNIYSFAGTPLGYTKLARETGAANNTVVSGYIELLRDLMVVAPAFAWDANKGVSLRRKPCKFHFINMLAASVFSPYGIRSIEHFKQNVPDTVRGQWLEWLVASELWRRGAVRGELDPDELNYWTSKKHEIDFIAGGAQPIEVKAGKTTALEFRWFAESFPNQHLTVLSQSSFESGFAKGMEVEQWLLSG